MVNLFDILNSQGMPAMARFAGTLLLFLALHLIRAPLLLAVRVIEASMRRVNTYATAPEFIAAPVRQEDRVHAYAA
jgi:hypothetical protein